MHKNSKKTHFCTTYERAKLRRVGLAGPYTTLTDQAVYYAAK
jgi:hypothetical protein